jgi:hypothetical protein
MARTHVLIALLRDGFNEQSVGGSVALRSPTVSPLLDYPLTEVIMMDGARRAHSSAMAEIQFAAGARSVHGGARDLPRRTGRAGPRLSDAIAEVAAEALCHARGQRPRDGRLPDGRRRSPQRGVAIIDGRHFWQIG